MDDLKSVTLDYLRALARKHLGPGHSKLTKRELIAALAQFVPALKKLVQPTSKATPPAAKPPREPEGKETRAVDKKKQPEKKTAERKPEPAKKAPEKRAPAQKAPQKKVAERKPEPEKKAPQKKAPEKKVAEKKVAEKKTAARKPEPEKKAPEKKAPEKKAATPKPEPEKKAPQKKASEGKSEPEKKAAAPHAQKAAPPRPAAPKEEDLSQSAKPAQVVNFPPRPRVPRSAEEAWHEDTAEMVVDTPELEQVFQRAAEPLLEGFFVARMMGERELRRHHLTEDQAPRPAVHGEAGLGYNEDLGELPLDYGNDLALALARDPYTLFITWDFSAGVFARAREGLDTPRAVLRVFDGDRMVREEEVALESRSFYIHGLPPGRPYRVEAHFVGRDGRSRRIGHSTHPLILPRTGPSQDTSVRFMQMPPPPRVPVQPVSPSGVVASGLSGEEPLSSESVEYSEEHQYIQWRRIPLPGSDEMVESSESRISRAARRARGEVRRPQYLENPPEYLEISARPPGASEQSAGRGGPDKGGASEQTHWTPPSSGRGR